MEQVAIDALEAARDPARLHELLDVIDRGGVARADRARAILTESLLEVDEAVVDRRREMRARAPGLTAAERAVVDQCDLNALSSELDRTREPGDPAADHDGFRFSRRCSVGRRDPRIHQSDVVTPPEPCSRATSVTIQVQCRH